MTTFSMTAARAEEHSRELLQTASEQISNRPCRRQRQNDKPSSRTVQRLNRRMLQFINFISG